MELFSFNESFLSAAYAYNATPAYHQCAKIYTPKGSRQATDAELKECVQDTHRTVHGW